MSFLSPCIFYTKCTYVCKPSLKLDMLLDGWSDGLLHRKSTSRTSSLWCPVFMTYITAPPVLVQPVLDLWGEHQLKTASFDHCVDCFLFTKRLIYILDTLDQLVTLCSRDRFRVCFPTAWWNTPVFCIDIQTWHRLHGAACASAQSMDATFWLFF